MSTNTFAVCREPGHSADGARANRMPDGQIVCLVCNLEGHHIRAEVFDALCNSHPRGGLTKVTHDDTRDYRYVIDIADRNSRQMSEQLATAVLTADSAGIFNDGLKKAHSTDFGEEYVTPADEAFPQTVDTIATKLTKIGFRQVGAQATNSGGWLTLAFGRRLFPGDPRRFAVEGVKVHFTWAY